MIYLVYSLFLILFQFDLSRGCSFVYEIGDLSGEIDSAEAENPEECQWIVNPGHPWTAIRLKFTSINFVDQKNGFLEIYQTENGKAILITRANSKFTGFTTGLGNGILLKRQTAGINFRAQFQRFSAGMWSEMDENSIEAFCDSLDEPHVFHAKSCYVMHKRREKFTKAFSDGCGPYGHLALVNDRATIEAINREFEPVVIFEVRVVPVSHSGGNGVGGWLGLLQLNHSAEYEPGKGWYFILPNGKKWIGVHIMWNRDTDTQHRQPDNHEGNEECGNLHYIKHQSFGGLNDADCNLMLTYQCEYESMCSCQPFSYVATETPQVIKSPNYPKRYCPNMVCYYNVKAQDVKSRVKLTLELLELGIHEWLEIFEDTGTSLKLIKTWEGGSLPSDGTTTSTNSVTIQFRSFQGYNKGFRIAYQQDGNVISASKKSLNAENSFSSKNSGFKTGIIVSTCFIALCFVVVMFLWYRRKRQRQRGCLFIHDVEDEIGSIDSDDFINSAQCVWRSKPGHTFAAIKLQFSVLSLKESESMEIFVINGETKVLVDIWYGTPEIRQVVTGLGNGIEIRFKTDQLLLDHGTFKGTFQRFTGTMWSQIDEQAMKTFCDLMPEMHLFHEKSCYALHQDRVTYAEAVTSCGDYGHLAFVDDVQTFEALDEELRKYFQNRRVKDMKPWIGLQQIQHTLEFEPDKGWAWVLPNGKQFPVDTVHWTNLKGWDPEPNDNKNNEECSNLYIVTEGSTGGINDEICGKTLEYLCEYESMCSCPPVQYTATYDSQVLNSPNYPESYCPDTVCYYLITAQNDGSRIKMTLDSAQLKQYDRIQLFEGTGISTMTDDNVLQTWHSSTPSDQFEVVSAGASVTLQFRSVQGYAKGFRISFKQIDKEDIDTGVFTKTAAVNSNDSGSDGWGTTIILLTILVVILLAVALFVWYRKHRRAGRIPRSLIVEEEEEL